MSSTTIFAVIVAVSNAIVAIFGYMLAMHNTRNDKNAKKSENIDKAEKELKEVCDNGDISELIDATKKIGQAKK